MIKVSGIEKVYRNVDVEVNPFEFLNGLKSSICGVPKDAYIKDGSVVTCEDVSYHGSPIYEYKTYEVSDLDKEIMVKISELEILLRKKLH